MGKRVWLWLRNPENQGTLSFIGGSLAVLVSGLWQLYTWTSTPRPEVSVAGTPANDETNALMTKSLTAATSGGGVAVVQTGAGHVTITNTTGVSEAKLVELAGEL